MKTACSMGPKPGKIAVKAFNARISAPTVERLPKLCNKVHLDIQSRYPSEAPVEDCTIFTVPGVLTAAECQLLLGYVQGSHPLERVAHAQTKSIAWRNVDR